MMPLDAADEEEFAAERLLNGSPSQAVTDHIVAILADVPRGVLAALVRYGTKIRFSDETYEKYSNGKRVIVAQVTRNADGSVALAHGGRVEDWLKRSIGRAFGHVLVSDMIAAAGGASRTHPGDLAQLADKGPGIRQSDRLLECWLAAIARKHPGEKKLTIAEVFAKGFQQFCTPRLRESLQNQAPEMFELMAELVATYDENGIAAFPRRSQPRFSRETWDESAKLIVNREDFIRTRIQKALQRLPARAIRLLREHGLRIEFKDPLGTRAGRLYHRLKPELRAGVYDVSTRRATIFHLDEGLIVHEVGHALDHALGNACFGEEAAESVYFSHHSLRYPGRSELGDRLIGRWVHANETSARVSRYARENVVEWFAESMKCYVDAGSDHHVRVGRFTGGDGRVETLQHNDPQLYEIFADIFNRIRHGVDINALEVIVPDKAVEAERATRSFRRSFRGKVIGRDHSAESIYVQRGSAEVVRITPGSLGMLADPPVMNEILEVTVRNGKVRTPARRPPGTRKGKEPEI